MYLYIKLERNSLKLPWRKTGDGKKKGLPPCLTWCELDTFHSCHGAHQHLKKRRKTKRKRKKRKKKKKEVNIFSVFVAVSHNCHEITPLQWLEEHGDMSCIGSGFPHLVDLPVFGSVFVLLSCHCSMADGT